MEREFTRSVFNKIFYSTLAVGFAIFFDVFCFKSGTGGHPFLILFPLLLTAFGLLVLVSQFVSKVIISADHIIKINITGRRELLTATVKGVRIEQKYIVIEPVSPITIG